MPNPRVAHCFFCDDVREEIGNKKSYMGIYSGELILQGQPPMMLPKIGLILWIITDIDDPISQITTTVLMPPDGQEIARFTVDGGGIGAGTREGAQKIVATQVTQIIPFPINAAGFIEVIVKVDDQTLRAGRLLVRFESNPASPTASPPPSGQSPPAAPPSKPSPARRRPSARRTARTPEPE